MTCPLDMQRRHAGQIETAIGWHPALASVFIPKRLTLGVIAPLEAHPGQPVPTMERHVEMAQRAERAGVAVLWLRDVPFLDPGFGDAGQVFDPLVYAGWLGPVTSKLVIGTAGIVAPLREPVLVAKQAATLDHLLNGRFLLGLASGDRETEYPAFGVDVAHKQERYREALALIRTVTERTFPRHESRHFGRLDGGLDLLPKPTRSRLPIVAIGRAGQDLRWLAEHTDAWIWHGPQAQQPAQILPAWHRASTDHGWRPYGYATWFDLAANPHEPLEHGRALRGGRHAVLRHFQDQERQGVSHLALNLAQSRRPVAEVLDEMAEHILPHFRPGQP